MLRIIQMVLLLQLKAAQIAYQQRQMTLISETISICRGHRKPTTWLSHQDHRFPFL